MMSFGRQYFTFDGTRSDSFGLWISGTSTYDAPERDVSLMDIPGRNGSLVYDNGRYKNIDVVYPAFMPRMDDAAIEALRGFLVSRSADYYRLTDTYSPDEYRLARYRGGAKFNVSGLHQAADQKITFDCKPQRFLISGETAVEISSGGTLTNPTEFPAAPLVRVYGNGSVSFGTGTITVSGSTYDYIDIDCDIMEAYNGLISANGYITLQGAGFPKILPGANTVTFTASRVIITPRWWRI